jgi:hypothetical protein
LRAGEAAAVVHLADEVLDHLLRNLEIGDDAVAQWPDRGDVARGAAEHLLGFLAYRQDLLASLDAGNCNHRRLVEDDAAALDVHEGVGGAEVDRHVRRQQAEKSA